MNVTPARVVLLACGVFVSSCELGGEWLMHFGEAGGGPPVVLDAGSSNRRPVLTMVFAAPLETGLGGEIELGAQAEDPDGDSLVYRWTGSGGKIAGATRANATYTCREQGEHAVVLRVFDRGGLEDTSAFVVQCD